MVQCMYSVDVMEKEISMHDHLSTDVNTLVT